MFLKYNRAKMGSGWMMYVDQILPAVLPVKMCKIRSHTSLSGSPIEDHRHTTNILI